MKSSICLILFTCGALQFAQAQGIPSQLKDTSHEISPTDTVFGKVEIESSFPGGPSAWLHFIGTHLVYPKKAAKKNIEGIVIIQFIIDKDGSPIDIGAISGPELLRQAAIDVVKQSPRWHPAMQNSRIVKSYKKQPFDFKLSDK